MTLSSASSMQCLWAPMAFAFGSQLLISRELEQLGVTWANIAEPPGSDSSFSLSAILLLLLMDAFIYFLAAWYISGVAPGRYGVAKPLYFPFMPSYWFGQKSRDCCTKNDGEQIVYELSTDNSDEMVICEDNPPNLVLGVTTKNLTKTYRTNCRRKKVTAIKNLSLDFFEGQITALLGHNGAGKTTTL